MKHRHSEIITRFLCTLRNSLAKNKELANSDKKTRNPSDKTHLNRLEHI